MVSTTHSHILLQNIKKNSLVSKKKMTYILDYLKHERSNTGTNLIMDETSPITCRPANNSNDEVTCECSVETERYNVESYECVSSCPSGEMWVEQDTAFEMIAEATEKGSCVSCPLGKSSDVGSWECQNLPPGQFGSGTPCPINSYSEIGAAECTDCPSGKYSDTAASQCIECDFMFRLSTHCDVPVVGMMMSLIILIVVVVASLLFRRYKNKQERIKQKLRLDLHRQKQLVKTKQTDINLLTGIFFVLSPCVNVFSYITQQQHTSGAWKLSANEIQAQEKIASGAYGEVWRGALHNRWVVAIKKLFPSASNSSHHRSSVHHHRSSVHTHARRRSTLSTSTKALFKDTEIKFLMRTWCSSVRALVFDVT